LTPISGSTGDSNHMIARHIREKRRRDLADDAEAGFDTTPTDDARLRQASPPGGVARGMRRSHNDVDISQRTAAPRPGEPENLDDAESPLKDARSQMSTGSRPSHKLRGDYRLGMWPFEGDAPPRDGYTEEAERITQGLGMQNPRFERFLNDPDTRMAYIEGLAAELRREGQKARPVQKPDAPKSQRQQDDDFWGNTEELKEYGSQANHMRRKL
jgi:hypothetical protein